MPCSRSRSHRHRGAASRGSSATPITPTAVPRRRDHHRAGPRAASASSAASICGRAQRRALQRTGDCRRGGCVDPQPCLGAPPGQRLEPARRHRRHPDRWRALDDRAADRMLGPHFERRREPQDLGRVAPRQPAATSTTRSRPWVSVPVLSKATHRIVASRSRLRTALDQDAFARGGCERGHDRDGRRNDQRAGARDHQQHERSIEPCAPAPRRARAAARGPRRRRGSARPACRSARSDRRTPGWARAAPAHARPGG